MAYVTWKAMAAPIARRARAKARWKIADLLGRLPGQCWADLVSWALDDRRTRRNLGNPRHPWRPVRDSCRRDLAANGTCYCGSLRKQPDRAEPPAVTP